jgi:hypothetical protein
MNKEEYKNLKIVIPKITINNIKPVSKFKIKKVNDNIFF